MARISAEDIFLGNFAIFLLTPVMASTHRVMFGAEVFSSITFCALLHIVNEVAYSSFSQHSPAQIMNITPYTTPFKSPDILLSPSGRKGTYNCLGVDCPFVFQHQSRFFMLHVGFDGEGYQTALAVSDDLLHWSHYANVLERQAGRAWNSANAAGIWLLRKEDTLNEVPELLKYDLRFSM